METITIQVERSDVYEEVAKATDYTGSKMVSADENVRDRILAVDDDFAELGRFWEEAATACNESLKEMLVAGGTKTLVIGPNSEGEATVAVVYEGVLEVSLSFDKALTASVESAIRSYFISSIIAQWFKFANKAEAEDYFNTAAEQITAAERLLYSRRKPSVPKD